MTVLDAVLAAHGPNVTYPGIVKQTSKVTTPRSLRRLVQSYLSESTKDHPLVSISVAQKDYVASIIDKVSPLRPGIDYVPSPQVAPFFLSSGLRSMVEEFSGSSLAQKSQYQVLNEVRNAWEVSVHDKKIKATHLVFSVDPRIYHGLTEKGHPVDPYLAASVMGSLSSFQRRFHPDAPLMYICGFHHDRPHVHCHVLVHPQDLSGGRVNISNMAAIGVTRLQAYSSMGGLDVELKSLEGTQRVDFQGFLKRQFFIRTNGFYRGLSDGRLSPTVASLEQTSLERVLDAMSLTRSDDPSILAIHPGDDPTSESSRIDHTRETLVRQATDPNSLPIFRQAVEDFMTGDPNDTLSSFRGCADSLRQHATELEHAAAAIEDIRKGREAINEMRPRGYVSRAEPSMTRGGTPFLRSIYKIFEDRINPEEARDTPAKAVLDPISQVHSSTVEMYRDVLTEIPERLAGSQENNRLGVRYANAMIANLFKFTPHLAEELGLNDPDKLAKAIMELSGVSAEMASITDWLEPSTLHYRLQGRQMISGFARRDLNTAYDPAFSGGKIDVREQPYDPAVGRVSSADDHAFESSFRTELGDRGFSAGDALNKQIATILAEDKERVIELLEATGLDVQNSQAVSISPDIIL